MIKLLLANQFHAKHRYTRERVMNKILEKPSLWPDTYQFVLLGSTLDCLVTLLHHLIRHELHRAVTDPEQARYETLEHTQKH